MIAATTTPTAAAAAAGAATAAAAADSTNCAASAGGEKEEVDGPSASGVVKASLTEGSESETPVRSAPEDPTLEPMGSSAPDTTAVVSEGGGVGEAGGSSKEVRF